MALDKKLEWYKETDEFQKILTMCNNKVENYEDKIIWAYNDDDVTDDLLHKMCNNEFDVKDLWCKFLEEITWLIKNPAWENLRKYYQLRLDNAELFLYQPINQYWQSNSILRYTDLDMLRWARSHYKWIEDEIDALIWTELTEEDKIKEKKKLEGAF